jgi:cytochrome c553
MSIKKIFLLTSFLFFAGFLFIFVKHSFALHKSLTKTKLKLYILSGKRIVLKSGCIRCHSFVKGKRTDNIAALAGWGNKHLSIKQTEKAIRSCRMDPYCSQILTDKQVKYVAYYLNSLK